MKQTKEWIEKRMAKCKRAWFKKGQTWEEHWGEEKAKELKKKRAEDARRFMKGRKFSEAHKENLSKSWDYKKHFNKETREKMSKARTGEKSPMYGKKRPDLTKRNLEKNPMKNIECRRKVGENSKKTQKRLWANQNYRERMLKFQREGMLISPNRPEKVMINLIKENNLPFNYVGDGKIWFTGKSGCYNPDFLSKNPKHIIEVFGDYWHNLPKIKDRDEERIKTYFRYGYRALIIWEHELKNPNQVLNKIRGFLG